MIALKMKPPELKDAIDSLGLSQAAFARQIGYTPETINHMLHGRRPVSRTVAMLTCELLQKEGQP